MMDTNVRQMNCCEQLVASQTELRAIVASMMPGCSAADIADVVQEANRAILRRAGEFDYRKPFMPLLATFARFQVMAWRKRHHGGVVVFDDELADKAAELWSSEPVPMGDPELLGKLKHCKELLNEQQRQLLDLRYQDGWSVARIAQDRRQTPSRVSVELYKIRTRLGDCIRRLCRLGDTPEVVPPEEEVLARSLANPEAGTGAELVRTLRADSGHGLMSIWLEQNWVDTLLAREAEILAGAREVPERTGGAGARFRPARIAAIGVLAVGLGLVAWAAVVVFAGTSRGQSSGGSVKGTGPVSLSAAASSASGTNSLATARFAGTGSVASVTGGTVSAGAVTNLSVVQAEESHEMQTNLSAVVAVAASLAAASVPAADYYVSPTGNDSNNGLSAETAFLTVDRAVTNGVVGDRVFVAPGDYSTTSQWGAPVKGALIGTGATRGDVVIRSAGAYRTLRTSSAAVISNLTIVGNTLFKADKGGAVEMTGGTIVDCVITGGTAYASSSSSIAGGNLYMSSGAQVLNCDIVGGTATNRGGNVYLDAGLISNCVIRGGAAVNKTAGTSVYGGNLFIYNGVLRDSVVADGTACRGGNIYVSNAAAEITGCTVSDGTASYDHAGNLFLSNCGVVSNCTFTGGTSAKYGGNALVQGGCTIANCVFAGGQTAARGGNVWVQNGNLVDCVLSNGTCTTASDQYDGGGNAYLEQGTLTRCRIVGGAITNGNDRAGGIHVGGEDTYTKVLEDCLIQGNTQGGLRYWRNVDLYNCSIVGNTGYGVYAYGGRHRPVLNVVIYGNTNTVGKVIGWNGTISTNANCRIASDDQRSTAWPNVVAGDFVNAADGDYHIAAESTLIDAGALDNRGDASVLDLDGHPRLRGTVDLGCYEYQKSDMTVSFAVVDAVTCAKVPFTVTFAHMAQNASGTVTYRYDFGDGSTPVSTTEATLAHTYETPGCYTVSLSAEDASTVASFTRDSYIGAVGDFVYVNPGNAGAAYPYATWKTAAATAKAAVDTAVSGCTVEFAAGVYELSEQLVLATNLTLRSVSGLPADVVLRNVTTNRSGAFRVLYITAGNVLVTGLTLEGGRVTDADGGNLLMSAGCVSNCVIRNGSVTAGWNNGVDGGARVMGSGVLTHCVISNNVLNGDVTGGANVWYRSAGVGLAGSAKMVNCLVAYNVYTAPDGKISTGCGGVLAEGAQTLLNCTIVSNQVHGKVTSNFPGARLGWHAAVQNCVFAENYSTEAMSNTEDAVTGAMTTNYVGMLGDVVPGDAYVTACASDGGTMLGVYATADQMFYRRKASDWWVPAPGGPLYDAGVTGDWTATDLDLAGKPRVFKRAVDIGCYESQLDPIGGFVIRICDSDLAVPLDWIQANLSEPDRRSDAAISNALVSAGSNGYSRWESYALGLDPNKAGSVMLCDARQDASASSVTFYAQNVTPATNADISVFYVLEGLQNGSWIPLLSCASNALPVALSSATTCYRIRADIVLK